MKVIEGLHIYGDEMRTPQPDENHRWVNGEWVFDEALAAVARERLALRFYERIDRACNTVLESMVGGSLRTAEYDIAIAEAMAFKSAGYPAADVPPSVRSWMIEGRDAEQAANEIIQKAEQFKKDIYALRDIRLKSKAKVRKLMSEGGDKEADVYVVQMIADISVMPWR